MAEILLHFDSSNLLWQLIHEASNFRGKTSYKLSQPQSSEPVDITEKIETLSELCTSAEFPMNVFCLLCNTSLITTEPYLSFIDPNTGYALFVEADHTIRLYCNNFLICSLNSRDLNTFGRIQSFFAGY